MENFFCAVKSMMILCKLTSSLFKKWRLILHKKFLKWIKCLSSGPLLKNKLILLYMHFTYIGASSLGFLILLILTLSSSRSVFVRWFSSELLLGWSFPTQASWKLPTISILGLPGSYPCSGHFFKIVSTAKRSIIFIFSMCVEYLQLIIIEINCPIFYKIECFFCDFLSQVFPQVLQFSRWAD